MKILLYNAGYCSGLLGSKREYLTSFGRYLHTPKQLTRQIEETIGAVVSKEQPDLCCFLEVHKDFTLGSAEAAYGHREVDNKYGLHSLLRRLPFFRLNCNAFFARTALPFHRRYLHEGTKRLLYDIDLGQNISLIVSHFSLSKRVRQQQFEELKQMIRTKIKTIVCGDFNLFDGEKELHDLLSSCNLRIVHPQGVTFPTVHPKKHFDLFLCSKDIDIRGWKVLKDCRVSDHLPVMLEI